MTNVRDGELYFAKAEESLAGAESEFANGRYNNCANRCYYACFQAAVTALLRAGVRPPVPGGQWGHAFVQSQFVEQFINRRKVYPPELRDVLARAIALRAAADYATDQVSETQAYRGLRRAREFVRAVGQRGGEGQ